MLLASTPNLQKVGWQRVAGHFVGVPVTQVQCINSQTLVPSPNSLTSNKAQTFTHKRYTACLSDPARKHNHVPILYIPYDIT